MKLEELTGWSNMNSSWDYTYVERPNGEQIIVYRPTRRNDRQEPGTYAFALKSRNGATLSSWGGNGPNTTLDPLTAQAIFYHLLGVSQ